MKKHALALAVVTALSGTAFAAANPVSMSQGAGQQLIFPYFSVQGDGVSNQNATLLTITNTDRTNAKLVKVRFRGASNSDDIMDFTLALSPADVWTGMVSQGDKIATLTTYDTSCTIPSLGSGVAKPFIVDRVKGKDAAETLEGYIEVITMADVPPTLADDTTANPLFDTIKHKSSTGAPECSASTFQTYLTTVQTGDVGTVGDKRIMTPATTPSLTGEWTLINQKKTAAWSGDAVALAHTGVTKVRFWPQQTVPATDAANWTTDPLLVGGVDKAGATVAASITAQAFDLPDLSTSYSTTGAVPTADNLANVTAALSTKSTAIAQYWTEPSINAVTDMLFSQPTRRYHVAYDYSKNAAVFKNSPAVYTATNTTVNTTKGQVCLIEKDGVTWPQGYTQGGKFNTATVFDREEYTKVVAKDDKTLGFEFSPKAPPTPDAPAPLNNLCGEVAVVSIGAGETPSALSASLTRNDYTPKDAKLVNGWMQFSFNTALPMLSASMIRVANGAVNYGIVYKHK